MQTRLSNLFALPYHLVHSLAPLLALDLGAWKPILARLSASIAAAAAVQGYYKFHDNWLLYRSTWDCLKREHTLKQAGISDYRGHADPNALFVERVEAIFRREGETWLSKHVCDDATAKQVPGIKLQEQ